MVNDGGDDGNWFAPKLFGYGTGLPIAWQGWAVLAAYLTVTIATVRWLAPHRPALAMAILVPATAMFMWVCWHHTRRGWRWRWGAE